jgi:hypothetical protein
VKGVHPVQSWPPSSLVQSTLFAQARSAREGVLRAQLPCIHCETHSWAAFAIRHSPAKVFTVHGGTVHALTAKARAGRFWISGVLLTSESFIYLGICSVRSVDKARKMFIEQPRLGGRRLLCTPSAHHLLGGVGMVASGLLSSAIRRFEHSAFLAFARNGSFSSRLLQGHPNRGVPSIHDWAPKPTC